ncbi:MAG TPA: cohesin domain-containing protein [Thermoanaerobaculia bacterium]|nr:cohesin domain-containing protein [Thermoanaerobaculia bacterium]
MSRPTPLAPRAPMAPMAPLAPNIARALACGMLLALLAACGGGGGGSPTGPPPPPSSIVFTPATGGAAGISLAAGSSSDPTTLVLEVRANGLSDLYGIAFNLSYPTAVLHFAGGSEGSLLNAGGTVATSLQVAEAPPGNLIVGLSRLGVVAGTSGSGVLLTLRFTGVASGSGQFAFARNVAGDSSGAPIGSAAWTAGSVQVTIVH